MTLLAELNALTEHHRARCPAYARILDIAYPAYREATSLSEVPTLPVGLFKSHRLVSVPDEEIVQTLTSSGTTGQPSRIYLDAETAELQSRALVRIMSKVLGPKRLPMVIVDRNVAIRRPLNARSAGILGMMKFGSHHVFVLDRDAMLDRVGLEAFLAKYGHEPFLVYGQTFNVWRHLIALDMSNGIIIHGGGWKRMQDIAVDNATFKAGLKAKVVRNFYGMAEQVGSIYMEGDDGLLHAPDMAAVIIRDPITWQEAEVGQMGVVQVLSTLPRSYPGHSLLTEDLGINHGDGFTIIGRVPRAEIRGCSDAV